MNKPNPLQKERDMNETLTTGGEPMSAPTDTVRRVFVEISVELHVTDEAASVNNVEERFGYHLWGLDPEETGIEVASVTWLHTEEGTL